MPHEQENVKETEEKERGREIVCSSQHFKYKNEHRVEHRNGWRLMSTQRRHVGSWLTVDLGPG